MTLACMVMCAFESSPVRFIKTTCQAVGLVFRPGGYPESLQIQNAVAAFARRSGSSDWCELPMIWLPDLELRARLYGRLMILVTVSSFQKCCVNSSRAKCQPGGAVFIGSGLYIKQVVAASISI